MIDACVCCAGALIDFGKAAVDLVLPGTVSNYKMMRSFQQ